MLSFPNAKINLGLNIVSKRPDGYHNIETCFYPIPWCDVLETLPSDRLKFTSSGLDIPGPAESNLCIKAYHLLKEKHDLPPVHIHLHKVIPMGAGLGGGSSDGAFVLKMLNEQFDLALTDGELEMHATELGSDCPFFIRNQPVFAEGTGSDFSKIKLSLKGKFIALIHPGIHVSTRDAYAGVAPTAPTVPIPSIISQPIETWNSALVNDFEQSVFLKHPKIADLKRGFYEDGAVYAAMSGSGSCVFGIFDHEPHANGQAVFAL